LNAYIDTSVLLRIVLAEPRPLREWSTITTAISSQLTRVEALRAIDRARIQLHLTDEAVAERRQAVLETFDGFHVAPVDGSILDDAANPFPTLLRTLDAIHLATALRVRDQFERLVFATHDKTLATAARAVGFTVIGAGR
jgi:uncharacterized protein